MNSFVYIYFRFSRLLSSSNWYWNLRIVPRVEDEQVGILPWGSSCRRRLKLAQVSTQGAYARMHLCVVQHYKQRLRRSWTVPKQVQSRSWSQTRTTDSQKSIDKSSCLQQRYIGEKKQISQIKIVIIKIE